MRFKFSFNDISVKAKLIIAVAVPVLALIFIAGKVALEGTRQVGQMSLAQSDTALLVTVGELIHELQREGSFSQLYLGAKGAGDAGAALKAQRAETDKRLAALRTATENMDASKMGAGPAEDLEAARKKIEALISKRADVTEQKIMAADLQQYYNDTLAALIRAEVRIRHEREQVDAAVGAAARTYVTLLEAKTRAWQTRETGVAGFEAGQFSTESFQVFAARATEMNKLFSYLFEIASPSAKEVWQKAHASNELKAMDEAITKAVQRGEGAVLWLSGEEWFRVTSAQANILKQVEDTFAVEMEQTASARATSILWNIVAEVGITLLLTLITVVLGIFVYRSLMTPVTNLSETVANIARGQYDARARVIGGDEMGMLSMALNQMLDDRVQALAKAERENDTLNNSVVELLRAVYVLSQRDLTTRCEVDETVIGTVADSINQLTVETAKVLGHVSRAAKRVGSASEKVKMQASAVHKEAEIELQSVDRMTAGIGKTADQVNALAELASDTNKSAGEAAASTNEALERVSDTVKGMESIRETIAETEKRIKRLGERSQEISGIVNLINTISERTHVLALNASMQAAIAGEAGRGFAVVAEEVQRLAESSRNATSQIAVLVNNIQIETNDTVATVNKTIGQVVAESELARKAGAQMEKTQRITAQLAEMVQRIAANAQTQAQSAQLLRQQVEQIGAGARQTREQIAAQSEQTLSLEETAQQLLSAIAVFKLPQEFTDSVSVTQSQLRLAA